MPVPGTMKGTGDAVGKGKTWPSDCADLSSAVFILQMKALLWLPFFLALHSVYQLLISAFNHFSNPIRQVPFFKIKTKEARITKQNGKAKV